MPMPPFQGSITALITPFKNGEVDATALTKGSSSGRSTRARTVLCPVRHHGRIADAVA